jgi:hypothetical protein
MFKDTYLLNMVIEEVSRMKNTPLEKAMEIVYNSKTIDKLDDLETGLNTYAPTDLAEMILSEEI